MAMRKLRIVFAGEPPDLTFVEVEDVETGKSVRLGEWSIVPPWRYLTFVADGEWTELEKTDATE